MRDFIDIVENASREKWISIRIDGQSLNVGWALEKDGLNIKRHQQSLGNAITLLEGNPVLAIAQFENGEERFKLIGRGADGKIIVGIVTWIYDTGEHDDAGNMVPAVRIVSCRYADRREAGEFMGTDRRADISEEAVAKEIDPENPPIASSEFAKAIPKDQWLSRQFAKTKAMQYPNTEGEA